MRIQLRDNGVYQLPDYDRTRLVVGAEDGGYVLYTLTEWERREARGSFFARPDGVICHADGITRTNYTVRRLHDTGETMPTERVENV